MSSTHSTLMCSVTRYLLQTTKNTAWYCRYFGRTSVSCIRPQVQTTTIQTYTTRPQSVLASTEQKVIPVFRHAEKYIDLTAIHDRHGDYTYGGIFLSSNQLASIISSNLQDRKQERVAFLCPNDASYVITQWACWMSGQIAVPLSIDCPKSLLEYYIKDSDAQLLIAAPEFADTLAPIAKQFRRKLIVLEDAMRVLAMKNVVKPGSVVLDEGREDSCIQALEGGLEDEFYTDSDAMILYTSGTTGSPKGVVLTHNNIQVQVSSQIQTWGWTQKDAVLLSLPLHHLHGIVNVLLCPLFIGARCVMLPRYESSKVWSHLLSINTPAADRISIFMGVPTMYIKLIEEYDKIFAKNARIQEYIKAVCKQKIRLMVSGSAPLPVPVFKRWEEITGHRLLERFGMTEVGMALSNPLNGERKPGFVGSPMPQVRVRIAKFAPPKSDYEYETLVEGTSSGSTVTCGKENEDEGELLIQGPSVFRSYWRRPEATEKAFTKDGWFRSGDNAQYLDGSYKIVGRTNIDLIKTGGFRVSALQVETVLLGHEDIIDCAVLGIPDITWGQKVAAVVVPKEGKEIILSQLRQWAKGQMAPHSLPTVLKIVEKLPKTDLGNVNKKELLKQLFPEHVKKSV